jgi:hypothetical protein
MGSGNPLGEIPDCDVDWVANALLDDVESEDPGTRVTYFVPEIQPAGDPDSTALSIATAAGELYLLLDGNGVFRVVFRAANASAGTSLSIDDGGAALGAVKTGAAFLKRRPAGRVVGVKLH